MSYLFTSKTSTVKADSKTDWSETVQALIGNNGWSSLSQAGRLYHVGTIPNLKGNIYAADVRLMIGSSPEGFFPVAIYARRARLPLAEELDAGTQSWDMLGTNLSFKVRETI
jgi:hypothetical protein